MSDESVWMERAQTAAAKLATLRQAYEPALERVKQFKANLGIKERSNGELVIDYQKFIAGLGIQGSLELRAIIDQTYNISGEPGKKPHVRLASG